MSLAVVLPFGAHNSINISLLVHFGLPCTLSKILSFLSLWTHFFYHVQSFLAWFRPLNSVDFIVSWIGVTTRWSCSFNGLSPLIFIVSAICLFCWILLFNSPTFWQARFILHWNFFPLQFHLTIVTHQLQPCHSSS